MPSKGRWALNPRKWFGTISNAAHKRAKKTPAQTCIVTLPPKTVQTLPSISIVPRILASRNKTRVVPSTSTTDNNYINSKDQTESFTQFRLPSFRARRQKTLTVSSSTLFHRSKTSLPTIIEPSTRKNGQFTEKLSVHPTRWNTEILPYDTSKSPLLPLLSSHSKHFLQENSIEKDSETNISDQCVVDCPQDISNHSIEKSPSPVRSHLSSSMDNNDEPNESSSSSGIFTDERVDLHDHPHTASKETLSTVEALSVESIADSQTSLNHSYSSASIQRYRLPASTYPVINSKSSQIQRRTPAVRFTRAHSAENILKANPITTPLMPKSRQSAAAILKKIEKRILTRRSSPNTLEKAGFVRITNATYRLTVNKDDHLYRRQHRNSIIPYSDYDDTLPSAHDEESYATLPRTSSTEQLNHHIQPDLRAVVDDYLRPMIASIHKTTSESSKTSHRSKRAQSNDEHTQININDISDRLLSSIDCSAYAQYQRCC